MKSVNGKEVRIPHVPSPMEMARVAQMVKDGKAHFRKMVRPPHLPKPRGWKQYRLQKRSPNDDQGKLRPRLVPLKKWSGALYGGNRLTR